MKSVLTQQLKTDIFSFWEKIVGTPEPYQYQISDVTYERSDTRMYYINVGTRVCSLRFYVRGWRSNMLERSTLYEILFYTLRGAYKWRFINFKKCRPNVHIEHICISNERHYGADNKRINYNVDKSRLISKWTGWQTVSPTPVIGLKT